MEEGRGRFLWAERGTALWSHVRVVVGEPLGRPPLLADGGGGGPTVGAAASTLSQRVLGFLFNQKNSTFPSGQGQLVFG